MTRRDYTRTLAIGPPAVTRAGYCTRCSFIRLSVANTAGVCDSCESESAQAVAGKRVACIRCGGWPVVYRAKCLPCNREDVRNYRACARHKEAEKVSA